MSVTAGHEKSDCDLFWRFTALLRRNRQNCERTGTASPHARDARKRSTRNEARVEPGLSFLEPAPGARSGDGSTPAPHHLMTAGP